MAAHPTIAKWGGTVKSKYFRELKKLNNKTIWSRKDDRKQFLTYKILH